MNELLYKDECYEIIGICMEVHNQLGPGFLEVVYKDALEYEFKARGIAYEREKNFKIKYKDIVLKHDYYADFVIFDKIILEVKAVTKISDEFIKKGINYCRASGCLLTMIVNFGEISLTSKRIIVDEKYRLWLENRKIK
jgi:GxxExxY protein